MILRPATTADLADIVRIETAGRVKPRSSESFAQAIQATHVQLTVLADPEVVGFLEFQVIADEAELLDIAVAPAWRRMGYGRQLMTYLLEQVQGRATVIYLEVREDNSTAQALYHDFGFVQVGRRKRYYPGGVDALLYSLS